MADWLSIAKAAAPIVSGIMGRNASQGDADASKQYSEQALREISNLSAPEIEKLKVYLQQYQSAGELDPQMEQAITQSQTSLGNIQLDPKYNEYQMSALKKMSEMASEGLPAIEKAQMQQTLQDAALQNMSQQKQIMESQAARGMAGSGNELAAKLAASQASANRSSNEALQIAAEALKRKMDATTNLASMNQAAQNADYNRQQDLANARDVINRFNTTQQSNAQANNISAMNRAKETNLANKQSLMNKNVDMTNTQNTYNTNLLQKDFDNRVQLGQLKSNAFNNASRTKAANAASTAGGIMEIGKGAIGLLDAFKTGSGNSSGGTSGLTSLMQNVSPDDEGEFGGIKLGGSNTAR